MANKKFPDLNKDGKITKADVLIGRGVVRDDEEGSPKGSKNYKKMYEQKDQTISDRPKYKDGGCVQLTGWGKARKR